ncbi:uncharacterized protein LOC123978514 isoform X4 [Micropterus dolomieu]|uniref:uncharacterized protein LOC123978514 isoform X4 n=1 Tax=Micropterus dolomieu TaxID=147949 RepID=UPI001E8DB6C1|nr:uncharacterized protein LOC123978514 isoform X4 [Micropterus dolomieu]
MDAVVPSHLPAPECPPVPPAKRPPAGPRAQRVASQGRPAKFSSIFNVQATASVVEVGPGLTPARPFVWLQRRRSRHPPGRCTSCRRCPLSQLLPQRTRTEQTRRTLRETLMKWNSRDQEEWGRAEGDCSNSGHLDPLPCRVFPLQRFLIHFYLPVCSVHSSHCLPSPVLPHWKTLSSRHSIPRFLLQ